MLLRSETSGPSETHMLSQTAVERSISPLMTDTCLIPPGIDALDPPTVIAPVQRLFQGVVGW